MENNLLLQKAILRSILDIKIQLNQEEFSQLEIEAKEIDQNQIMKNVQIEQELS